MNTSVVDAIDRTKNTEPAHWERTLAQRVLRALGAPVIPVLQGWSQGQYLDHVEAYELAGLDL